MWSMVTRTVTERLSEQIAPTIDQHHMSDIEDLRTYFSNPQKELPPEIRDKIRRSLERLQNSGLLDVKTLGVDENGEDILQIELLESILKSDQDVNPKATLH